MTGDVPMTFQRFMRPVQAVSAAGLVGAAAMVTTEE
jgi:hypothetical protein